MTEAELIEQQDRLRPLRMFFGAFSGALAGYDQALASEDAYSWNLPYRYQSVGPTGVAVEGAPIAISRAGGLFVSPMVVLIGIGVAAAMLIKKG